jgi:esterase/lipase superfamily enzyme
MPSMLIVSCRKDFWSATDFSTTDAVRRVDLDTGVGTPVSQDAFLQEVQRRRLMVLVHGYNNEERDVVSSYGTIDRRMRQLGFLGGATAKYNGLVGFAWPGGAVGVSFPFARQRAAESSARFARLLAELRSASAELDLNTHSLGAHVALEALRSSAPQIVRNAWNFAAAVDNESIENRERYYQASGRCDRFYVFHSKNDPVLRVWYRVGDFFDFDTALGYSGPEDPGAIIVHSPHVRVINCKDIVHSHGGYRAAGEVWAYMAQELTAPTADQFVTLSRTPEVLNAVFRASGGVLKGGKPSHAVKSVSPGKGRKGLKLPGTARPSAKAGARAGK